MLKNTIILGTGRSGTSLMMGLLSEAGYYMGEKLIPARGTNPKGFFESEIINDLNEQILAANLARRYFVAEEKFWEWDEPLRKKMEKFQSRFVPKKQKWRTDNFLRLNLPRLPFRRSIPILGQRWLAKLPLHITPSADAKVNSKIEELIQKAPFAYKDPRFSYTLPAWLPHLDLQNTVFIVLFRHPSSTVKSILKECATEDYLKNKLKITAWDAFEMWRLMYSHIVQKHMKVGNWLFVHFEQLLDGTAFEKIQMFTNATLNEDFVERKYYRSKSDPVMPSSCETIYTQLCKLASYTN